MWPGMTYYLTIFYPPSRIGKRIGQYFTAAQVSAAVVGLVSAGFQEMDGLGGLVGFQWMFLLYGLVTFLIGIALLWWLPDRPLPPGQSKDRSGWRKWIPNAKPALRGEDARIHYEDLTRVYHRQPWTLRDLWAVVTDWRAWFLVIMYFGVVGVGIVCQRNIVSSPSADRFLGRAKLRNRHHRRYQFKPHRSRVEPAICPNLDCDSRHSLQYPPADFFRWTSSLSS